MFTEASSSHSRTQLAHHHCRTKAPTHIQATVRPGDSVSMVIALRLFLASAAGLEKSANPVRGRNNAVNASRLQCTPTSEVYRAYGKNGFGELDPVLGAEDACSVPVFLPDATRDVVPAMLAVANNVGSRPNVSACAWPRQSVKLTMTRARL